MKIFQHNFVILAVLELLHAQKKLTLNKDVCDAGIECVVLPDLPDEIVVRLEHLSSCLTSASLKNYKTLLKSLIATWAVWPLQPCLEKTKFTTWLEQASPIWTFYFLDASESTARWRVPFLKFILAVKCLSDMKQDALDEFVWWRYIGTEEIDQHDDLSVCNVIADRNKTQNATTCAYAPNE